MAKGTVNLFRQRLTRRLGIAMLNLGVSIERTAKSHSFDALLIKRLKRIKRDGGRFFFLQIGANDGISHDPIHGFVTAHRLAGIVIEPLPDVFEALCTTYASHDQIQKLNIAIHEELDRVVIHRPDPAKVDGMSGIASIDPDRFRLTNERTGLLQDDIQTVEVPAQSLTSVLNQQDVTHLDLLQIDTEGYDMNILAGLDLSRWRPSIIRFEHGIYSGVPARKELRETLLRLYDAGYAIAMERVDAVAWLQEDIAKRPVRTERGERAATTKGESNVQL